DLRLCVGDGVFQVLPGLSDVTVTQRVKANVPSIALRIDGLKHFGNARREIASSPHATAPAFEHAGIRIVRVNFLDCQLAANLWRARSAVLEAPKQQPDLLRNHATRERPLLPLALAFDVVEFLAVIPFLVALVLSEMLTSLRNLRKPKPRRVHLALDP